MAAKRDVNGETQRSDPNEADPAGAKPGGVDALVSSFLAELTDISAEMKPIQRREAVGEAPADSARLPRAGRAEIPPSAEIEEVRIESRLDPDDIDNEIEKTLVELERLKSNVIPISDVKNSKPESLPAVFTEPRQPTAASPLQPGVESDAGSPASPDSDEQAWDRLELFRTRVASSRLSKPSTNIIVVLAVAISLLGILYFFLSEKNRPPVSKSTGQVPDSVATDTASSRNDLKEVTPASQPKESGLPQPAGTAGTLIQDRTSAQSEAIAKPKSTNTPSRSALLSQTRPRSTVKLRDESFAAKPRALEQPVVQTSAPASGSVSLPPAPMPLEAAPPAVASASQPPPRSMIQSTPASGGGLTDLSRRSTETARTESPGGERSASAQPRSESTRVVTTVMSEPVVRVQPTYPTIARMQKVSGIVEVDAYINEKGDVVRAQAVSGPMLLRAAAEEAVMKWKFKPASINSVNIASQARISVSFKMK